MKRNWYMGLLIIVWSLFVRIIVSRIGKIASLFSDRVRDQLAARPQVRKDAIMLAARRRSFDDCVVFFCSSAGEYEQAKPIIDMLSAQSNVLCHVFFFSDSGRVFIESRKEAVSWSMSPLDDAYHWGTLFGALRPSKTIIVRHELWPAFLWAASQWGEVLVVNAVVPALFGRQPKWRDEINLMAKGVMFGFVSKICAVSTHDKEFFERWLRVKSQSISVTGDTKYDRVILRCRQKSQVASSLRKFFREEWSVPGCDRLLIAGSVHLPDVKLILSALNCSELLRVKVLLVPHDVSSGNVARIYDAVKQEKYSCELLSEVENKGYQLDASKPRFIIADEMGRLSDLYAVADFSWVGGAVHAKIHNVLEPGIWGLPISGGNLFANSQEAVLLHNANLLFASNDFMAVRTHWIKIMDELSKIGMETREFIEAWGGATKRIVDQLTLSKQETTMLSQGPSND